MFDRLQTSLACDKALCQIATGNSDAIAIIYDRCAKKIFFLAKSITKSEADSEDVLQNTMLKILSSAKQYHPGTNSVAWILTVARNCALNFLRSRHEDCSLEELQEEIPDADPYVEYAALYDALGKLSSQDRQIVVMKVQLCLSHKEIAQILSISTDAAQKRYKRAVQKLNQTYKK